MANEPEGKDFKVVDPRSTAEEPPKKDEPIHGPGWQMKEQQEEKPLPPMDFTTFCLSLASSAMIHLGLAPMPESEKIERNLPLAKQTIDILVLLDAKTQGNLTEGEAKLLSTLLYDLRLRFVQEKAKSP
jgi:hypothetical protein